MTENEEWTYFTIYFITVNKYRFCISVIGQINVQIISIVSVIKNQYRSITNLISAQTACNTPKRKQNVASYDPFK